MKSTIDNVPDRQRQTTIFDDSVASRVEQLLQRVAGVRRGTTITRPTQFNAAGERHARQIAQRDQVQESRTSTRNPQ